MDAPQIENVEFNEEEAYNKILTALLSLEAARKSRCQINIPKPVRLESVALETGRTEILDKGSIHGLHKLDNTDHLFIQFTKTKSPFIPEMKRKFEILNALGERVLYAVENTGYMVNAFSYSSYHDFDYCFIDPNTGIEAFRVVSRARFFGVLGTEMRIFKDKDLLGKVIQTGEYGSTMFTILSATGRIKFLIKPSDNYVEEVRPSFIQRLNTLEDIDIEFPEEFQITSADDSNIVGRIIGIWASWSNDLVESDDETSSDSAERDDEYESSSSNSGDEKIPQSENQRRPFATAMSSRSMSISDYSTPHEQTKIKINNLSPKNKVLHENQPDNVESVNTFVSGGTEDDPPSTKRFNRERFGRFVQAIEDNIDNWRWFSEGEYFGVHFTNQLSSISRALIVAVLLLQYFRIHFDRHHRSKSSRILYRKNFRHWCLMTGFVGLIILLVISLDIYRDKAPD